MKLKIRKREGSFSPHINGRAEGSGDGKKPAADLSVSFMGTKSDIDMMVPMLAGEKFSDIVYDDRGQLLAPHISPLKVHRKPEGLTILIYDQGTKKPLKFTKAAAKNIVVTLHQKRNCEVSMTLQVHPEASQGDRLFNLMRQETAEFEIEAAQEELFTDEDEDGNEEGGGDEAQQELGVDEDEDEDEDEDDDQDE